MLICFVLRFYYWLDDKTVRVWNILNLRHHYLALIEGCALEDVDDCYTHIEQYLLNGLVSRDICSYIDPLPQS